MEPTARHGQLVIASSLLKSKTDKTVIIRHNKIDKIKRIVNVKQDEIYVLGDNPAASTDSRVFGWLPKSCIIATVIWPKK
jgi:type IV secretory pathway protease TraF